jgi:hypothetical protein
MGAGAILTFYYAFRSKQERKSWDFKSDRLLGHCWQWQLFLVKNGCHPACGSSGAASSAKKTAELFQA